VARPRRAPANGGIFAPDEEQIHPGRNAVTASGQRVNPVRAENYRRLNQQWQSEALSFYDTSGECWYAAQFYSRAISKLRLYAAKVDENGEMEEIEVPGPDEDVEGGDAPPREDLSDADQAAVDAVARIKDTSGGRGQLLGSWARLMFLTGETYLTITNDPATDEERWECLSSDELRLAPGRGYVRYAAPSAMPEELQNAPDDAFEPLNSGKTAVVYRLWRRHPRYSLLADAPMRACLSLFEELQLLQLAVRARARSRLSGAGILAVPTEIVFANLPTGSEQDQKKSPIMEMLQRAASTAIQNPGSASAVVPIVIQGPAEYLKELRWISIGNAQEKYEEQGLRVELLSRIAIGLDFPKEQLLGMGDANHWTAWLVDDQTWSAHLQPMANLLVEDLTGVYLQPYLKKQGVENWHEYAVGYDAAEVINHPDRNKDAAAMYAAGELSGATWREVAGFGDGDEMDQEEFQIFLAKTFGDPQMLPDKFKPEEPAPPEEPDPTVFEPENEEPEEGLPPEEKDREEAEEQQQVETLAASAYAAELSGVARATVRRARELAGSRLRTRVRKNEELNALVNGCQGNALVAAKLGPERCATANLGTPRELVASAGDGFGDIAAEFGLDPAVGRRIATMLEDHAAKTLFEENPAPVPPRLRAYLERVL
jgi:hypothetical protein